MRSGILLMGVPIHLNVFCKSLYAEVERFGESKRHFLPRTERLKFGIFYSPPQDQPELMIIGANPGFDSDDDTKTYPDTNLFYDCGDRNKDEWKIAAALGNLFELAGEKRMLRDSVVTNLLFFKSRCLGKHAETGEGWRDNGNAEARREIEHYCEKKVEEIVVQLAPKRILAFGLGTWNKLAEGHAKVLARRTEMRGRLAVTGTVFNRSGFGIVHPTGARMSRGECRKPAPFLREFLVSPSSE